MNHLIIATLAVKAEFKQQERRLEADMFGGDDNRFEMGVSRGLEKAYEILVEQLKEAQPEVVSQLHSLRCIINKM